MRSCYKETLGRLSKAYDAFVGSYDPYDPPKDSCEDFIRITDCIHFISAVFESGRY